MSLGLKAFHSAGEFSPRYQYDGKAGRLSKVDRSADGASNIKTDVTMTAPPLALDIGSILIGWANFNTGGAPSIVMVPYGQTMPARPDPAHKAGFRAKVWDGRDPVAREFSSNAGVTVNAIEALWDLLTAMPEAAAGQVPVIRLVNVEPITSQRGTNYAPVFALVQWIDRDVAVFGPRTVAAPGAAPILAAPVVTLADPAPAPAPAPVVWPVASTTPAPIPAAWPAPSQKAA